MNTMPCVIRAEDRGGYRIRLTFNDDQQKTIDFAPPSRVQSHARAASPLARARGRCPHRLQSARAQPPFLALARSSMKTIHSLAVDAQNAPTAIWKSRTEREIHDSPALPGDVYMGGTASIPPVRIRAS